MIISIRHSLWPKAEAIVLDSGFNASKTAPVNGGSHTVWKPFVVYEYEVDGQTYTNHKISTGLGITISPKRAQKVADKYFINSYIKVSYNPSNPEQSIINTKPPISSLVMLVFSPFIIIIGLAHAAT